MLQKIKNIFTFSFLILLIGKTFFKRIFTSFKKKYIPLHVYTFLNKKKKYQCNLDSLRASLRKHSTKNLQVAPTLKLQKNNFKTEDLLSALPSIKEDTEILAIPLAIKAFTFFRHFVTIIVDKRENLIEFYDPIGFTIEKYDQAVLWNPKGNTYGKIKLKKFFKIIQKKYAMEKVVENTKIDQKDFNQCAVYVFDRIYKRSIQQLSFEQASKAPLSSNYVYTS